MAELDHSYRGDVALFDGVHDEGEVLKDCIISTLGDRITLTHRDEERRRYVRIDALGSVECTRNGKTKVTFQGQSEMLRTQVGVAAGVDASAKWVVTLKGCQECG